MSRRKILRLDGGLNDHARIKPAKRDFVRPGIGRIPPCGCEM
ncbi:MAG: hypothetical protein WD625_01505 [Balneolales bacterium]